MKYNKNYVLRKSISAGVPKPTEGIEGDLKICHVSGRYSLYAKTKTTWKLVSNLYDTDALGNISINDLPMPLNGIIEIDKNKIQISSKSGIAKAKADRLILNENTNITGSLKLDTIAEAGSDTDKFLVSDSGTIKYRTGTQILSDLGISADEIIDWTSDQGDTNIHANNIVITHNQVTDFDTEITSAIDALIDSAPGALNTLNELAAALGDDANFSTTVTNSLATKVGLTGDETVAGHKKFSDDVIIAGTAADRGTDDEVSLGIDGNILRIHTNYGRTDIGPANTSWSHFKTDMSKFYFNKSITVDEGVISSYNEDVILRRSNDAQNQLLIGDDSLAVTLGGDSRFSIDGSGDSSLSGHFNITTGHEFKINDTSVLSNNTLGSGVTASSLTSVGTITSGTWQGTAIAHAYIANDAIDGDNIADNSINSEHYVDESIDNAHIATDAVTGAKVADDTLDSQHYIAGSIDTEHIADDQVTYAKIQNVSNTNRILGRDSDGAGVIEEISPANVRTMINVEDGAQANVSGNSGNAAIYDNSGTPAFKTSITKAEVQTLLNIEDGATADQTGPEIAAALNADLGGNFTIGNQSDDSATFSGDVIIGGDLTVNGGDMLFDNLTTAKALIVKASDNESAAIELHADDASDNEDKWQIEANKDDGDLYFYNMTSGSWAQKFRVTDTGNAVVNNALFIGSVPSGDGSSENVLVYDSGTSRVENRTYAQLRSDLGIADNEIIDWTASSAGTIHSTNIPTLNQDTTGTAAIATTVTVADESSDTTCFPLFVTSSTGNQAPKSGTNLKFNSSTGLLTATKLAGTHEATNIGATGSTGLDSSTNTEQAYADLPIGYSAMMHQSLGTDEGMPLDSKYFYFHKVANRDSGGGWGGLAFVYNEPWKAYLGATTVNTSFATWNKILVEDSSQDVSIGNDLTVGGDITPSGYIELSGDASDPGADGKVRLGESGNALRTYTNYGYITMGPQNASWAHFYTDRANYYFNTNVVVDGGIVASYDEDLVLRRTHNDTTYNQITIGDDTLDIKLDNTSRLAIDGNGKVDLSGDLMLRSEGGIFIENSVTANGGSIIQPAGGMYRTSSNTHTGLIKITVPRGTGANPTDMISFWVDVFDYGSRDSFSMYISGYVYQDDGSNEWHNVDAMSLGTASLADYTVRFGHDGSNHCITIGETDTGWNYLQVTVRNVQVGYSSDIDDYLGDWTISVETSLPSTVDETVSGNFPIASRTIGTADIATTVTLTDQSSDSTCFPVFSTANTGDRNLHTNSSALTYDSTNGTITAGGFTTTGTWTFDEFTSGTVGITTVQDSGTNFNDNDTSLLTAGAISDYVTSLGYTTNTGDITNVKITTSVQADPGASNIINFGSGDANFSLSSGTGVTVAGRDDTNTVLFSTAAAQTGISSILNTSLVAGRDADNQIKFSTDDQIIFRVAGGDGVTFKASGEIEATKFDGALEGNADTATALATARAINGVDFDGTGDITIGPDINALSTSTTIVSGDYIGFSDQSLGDNGTRKITVDYLAELFAGSGLTATNGVIAVNTLNQDTTGTAAIATSITVTGNNDTDETVYPVFVDGATGTQGAETDTGLTYNPSSGQLTTSILAGDIKVGGHTFDDIDIAGEFVDSDSHIMSSAAIQDKIESYNYITATISDEDLQDKVGAMFSGNTETGITVTYQDGDNNIDLSIDAAQTGITSLLATDIKIGEDDQTKIDFETADEIHFYAANVHQVKLVDNIFTPEADSDVDLGATSTRWKKLWVDDIQTTNDIVAGGDITLGGNDIKASGSNVAFSTSADAATQSVAGDLQIGGQDILSGDSTTCITLSNSTGNVTFAGDITVTGNDIRNSDGDTTITMDSSENVTIAGDLTVNGNDFSFDAGASTIGIANASGANTAGNNLTISAGAGTGSGAGGSLVFRTADGGGSGSSANSHANALVLADDLDATFGKDISISGDNINFSGGGIINAQSDLTFRCDSDQASTPNTSKFSFKNGGNSEIASIDESGNLTASGTVEANAITIGGTALADAVTITNSTNAAHVHITDNESTNEENQITFIENASGGGGNRGLEADGDFTYNPSTGMVTAKQMTASTVGANNLTVAATGSGGSGTYSSSVKLSNNDTDWYLKCTGGNTSVAGFFQIVDDSTQLLKIDRQDDGGDVHVIKDLSVEGSNGIIAGAPIWIEYPFSVTNGVAGRPYYRDVDDLYGDFRKWDDYDTSPTSISRGDVAGHYVVPGNCTLKGLHAVVTNTTSSEDIVIGIYYGTPNLDSGLGTTLALAGSELTVGINTNTYNYQKTGTFDVDLSAGDIIVPMVEHNNTAGTNQTFRGNITLKLITR